MKAETRNAGPKKRLLFAGAETDPIVASDDDPAASSRLEQPLLIIGVLLEDLVVRNDVRVNLSEPIGHLSPAEASIDEELRRRLARGTGLRRGPPLRPFQCSIHS